MASKKSKKIQNVGDSPFGEALDAWASENPRAWDDAAQSKTKKAPENELAGELRRLKSSLGLSPTSPTPAPKPVLSPEKLATLSPSKASRFAAAPQGRRQVTAEDLMAEAFEALDDPSHNPTAKYVGDGYAAAKDVDIIDERAAGIVEEAEERYGAIDGATEDDLVFLDLMASADVSPLDRGLDRLRTALDERRSWVVETHAAPPTDEDLMEPTLSSADREVLRRARKQGYVPTLQIRMMRRSEAVAEVARFVRDQWEAKTRYIRIITGKGKNSEGPVVLKPAVIEWVSIDPGNRYVNAWSPEVDRSGAYGALILELRRKSL